MAEWTTEYVHTDHLGSAAVTTAADGSVVHEQWFGPFGRRLDPQGRDLPRNTGVPDGLRVGFTGHEQEDTLGLVDMRGRYYDPTQRRFLTPDPIIASPLSTQAFSPYAYVDNNPLSRIDPTGFWGESADENGFLDEGDWDLSGMDGGGGGGSPAGGGGGMSADHDDYDQGDMDFDPGEAMAGQDEEGGNDGTDDWSDSGSKEARDVEGWFFSREVLDNYQEANGRTLLRDLNEVAYNEFGFVIRSTPGERGETFTAYDLPDIATEIEEEIEGRAGSFAVRAWSRTRDRWMRALSGEGVPVVEATDGLIRTTSQLAFGTMAYLGGIHLNQIAVRSDAGPGQFVLTVQGDRPLTSAQLARARLAVSIFFQFDHDPTHPFQPMSSELEVVLQQNATLRALGGVAIRTGYPTTVYTLDGNTFQWVVPQNVR